MKFEKNDIKCMHFSHIMTLIFGTVLYWISEVLFVKNYAQKTQTDYQPKTFQ